MADSWQPVSVQDDAPAPNNAPASTTNWSPLKVEDDAPQPLRTMGNKFDEADYQAWVHANTKDGEFQTPSMGDQTVSVDPYGNGQEADLRAIFKNNSLPVAAPYQRQVDVTPSMLEQYQKPGSPQLTDKSVYAGNSPKSALGSWDTDDQGNPVYRQPGYTPASATQKVMDKAVDLATKGGDDIRSFVTDSDNYDPIKSIDNAADVGAAALKGLGGSFHGLAEDTDLLGGAFPVLYDKAASLFTGKDTTAAQDAWFRNTVTPLKDQDEAFDLAKNAGLPEKVAHTFGDALGVISQAILTGGEAAPLDAAMSGTDAAKAAIEHGTKAMAVPATQAAIDTGQKVYQETGDANKALKAAQVQWLVTSAGGYTPLSTVGTLPVRLAQGAVAGTATGEAGRQAMNQVLPADMQTSFSPENMTMEALMGATMGGLGGHGQADAPEYHPNPTPTPDEMLQASRNGEPPPTAPASGGALGSPPDTDANMYNAYHQAWSAADRGDYHIADPIVAKFKAAAGAARATADANPGNGEMDAAATQAEKMASALDEKVNKTQQNQAQDKPSAPNRRAATDAKTNMVVQTARDSGEIQVQASDDGHVVTVNDKPVATFQTAAAAEKAADDARGQVDDRRIDAAMRKKVGDMSPDEMKQELLTHPLTGIPNRRAYDESEKLPAQVAVDANSLKWVNDEGGHEAGDHLLKAIATALHDESPDTYHIGGDEFVVQAKDQDTAAAIMQRAKQRLAGATIEMSNAAGHKITLNGIGISHGISSDLGTADRNLQLDKQRQESAGLRAARGEQPPGAHITAPEAGLPGKPGESAEDESGTSRVLGQDVETPAQPTPKQAEAGNYRKGEVDFHGLPIAVENVEGQYRTGRGDDGKTWRNRMKGADYGYFKGTKANDGDGVDVFMGKQPDNGHAYVIDQLDQGGKHFDEHKVVVGVKSADEAKALYLRHYEKGWKGFGGVTELPLEHFKKWLKFDSHEGPLDAASVPAVRTARGPGPDARHDSILQFLARHPRGLDSEEAGRQGVDAADMRLPAAHVGIKRAFRKGGMSFDHAAETLHEAGYPVADEAGHYNPNTLLDKLSDELRGRSHYSVHNESNIPDAADLQQWRRAKTDAELQGMGVDELEKLHAQLEAAAERAALQREHEPVSDSDLDAIPFARQDEFQLTAPGGKAGSQPERKKVGGEQQDLFGDKVAIANELARVKTALDAKRNTGQKSLETGDKGDLFSQAAKQGDLIQPKKTVLRELTEHPLEAEPGTLAARLAAVEKELGLTPVKTAVKTNAPGGKGHLDASKIDAAVHHFLDKFQVPVGGVRVADSLAELLKDPEIGPVLLKAGADAANTDHRIAFVHPRTGKMYFIADQIHSLDHLAGIVAHEYIVHHGLRAALGNSRNPEYQAILDGVAEAMPGDMAARGRREFGDKYDPSNKGHRNIAAEETLAYYGQRYVKGQSVPERIKRWLDRLHTMIRDWVRNTLGLPKKFDELFVKRTLGDLEAFLRRSRSTSGAGAANQEPAFAGKQDTFYSGLAKAVDAAKREKGTGAEWEATLRNMPGVKAEELQWTGVKDWLEGRGRVSKAEVAAYVNAHRVELGEVQKNSAHPQEALDDGEIFQINDRLAERGLGDLDPEQVAALQRGGADTDDMLEALRRVGVDASDMYPEVRGDFQDHVKFQNYATPGGTNYREMLMTLSDIPASEVREFKELGDKIQREGGFGKVSDADYNRYVELGKQQRQPIYKSQHWVEPNVLAHVRYDDRVGPNGEKILHVHEIQSDWHQAGRKEGYHTRLTPEERQHLEVQKLAADVESRSLMRAGRNDDAHWNALQVERATIAEKLAGKSGVPDAPFKTTWPELAMKRMLRMAAEGGYDKLSWDTGDTNAERYNMSHVVDAINLRHNNVANTYDLVAKKGAHTIREENGLSEDALARMIGKEAAQKAISQRDNSDGVIRLTGDDLKVGGVGMRGFYDEVLPRTVGKLVKKWGSSVEPGTVLGADKPIEGIEAGADNALNYQHEILAHTVDITPAMRDSVMEGQPMFAKGDVEDRRTDDDRLFGREGAGGKAYGLVRRAASSLVDNRLVGDVVKLLNPKDVSSLSKEAAMRTSAFLGELAHQKQAAQEHLQQFTRAVNKLSPNDQLAMIDAIETGAKQPIAAMQPVADAIRKMLNTWRDNVRSLGDGHLENFIENYFPHWWRDQKNAASIFASIQGRRTMTGPKTFLKKRTIPTTKQGIEYGLKPITTNPLVLTLLKIHEMQRFISGVTMMRAYKDAGLAKFVPATKSVDEGWKEINDPIARVSSWSETEGGFVQRGRYAMPEDAARVVNNHLSASALANFAPAQAVRIGANILNSMQLGFSAFHLGFTTLDAMVSKNALGIERLLSGEPLKALAAFAEGTTPAGALMNINRGMKLMNAYLNPAGATPELRAIVHALAAGGGRVHMDRFYLANEGVSPFRGVGPRSLMADMKMALTQPHGKVAAATKAIGSFPIEYAQQIWNGMAEVAKIYPAWQLPFEAVGRLTRASSAWIMEHLVPMQKLGVFSDMASDWLRRNPNATPEEMTAGMQAAWRSVDNRLGEMVYDNLFWNRTFKDALHLGIRAVGWNLGTVREIAGAPFEIMQNISDAVRDGKIPKLGHKGAYVLGLAMTQAIVGSIIGYLYGQPPKSIKDLAFPRTGRFQKDGTPERVSLPSYVKDVYEYYHHPVETVAHKANPWIGVIHDEIENTDYFGDPIYDPDDDSVQQFRDRVEYLAKSFRPFSFSGGKQMVGADDPGWSGTVARMGPYFGLTPAPGVVTKPEKIEAFQHHQDEVKWKKKLIYEMKQAREAGDKAKAKELQQQINRRKPEEARERAEYLRKKAQDMKNAGKTSGLIEAVGPLIDSSSSRAEMAQKIHAAGYPALAGLIGSLPDRLRPQMAEALERESA